MLNFKWKSLHPEAVAPKKSQDDIGWDLSVVDDKNFKSLYRGDYLGKKTYKGLIYELAPSQRHIFSTGVSIQLPQGYHSILKPRSGLAVKNGIDILAGVIDNGYSGEILVCLQNHGNFTVSINPGDRICQMIIVKEEQGLFREVDELDDTTRGNKGFGSTGK